MEKKFRYYDPFNDCYSYSDNFKNLALFFHQFQMACDGENNPVLEQWTGLYDSTAWEELTEEKREEWTRLGDFPSVWEGIPIYENDAVKIPENYDEFGMNAGEIYQVYFAYGGFRLKPKYKKASKGFWVEDGKILKVIGSATSNPELLEEK